MNLNLWFSRLNWKEQMKVRKFVILLYKMEVKNETAE